MKKFFAILILCVFVTTGAFASILQVGPAANINFNATKAESEVSALKDFNKYQFGAEARVNLFFLQLGANGLVSLPDKNGNWAVNSMLSANLVAGPNLVNLSFGAAIPYVFGFGPDASEITPNSFLEQELMLKAGLNFNLAFVGLGVSYYIPTGLAAKNVVSDIQKMKIDFDRGQLSLAVMFNLF